ncbi:hypothetical protein [Curtobacterium sp. APC 4022]|uniref:hypothetical protein n=1 Tax=Curtobacterium sp. APC 4022 TaxID=3035201 RepID=UPI0025B401FA|nr:hypothetical protein [Curtobacterium sp. APC 4022]MDN3477972.1 hypothetical protein [Curtobacterium sp. APC 4022]
MSGPREPLLPTEQGNANWAAATQLAEVLVGRGPIVVGASLQGALAGMALLFFALGTTLSALEPSSWKAIVSGAGPRNVALSVAIRQDEQKPTTKVEL